MITGAIDPGKFTLAIALSWGGNTLNAAYWRKYTSFTELAHACDAQIADTLIIEKPRVYPNSNRGKNPNDLVDLGRTVGVCHRLGEHVIEVYPAEWKGQTPKKIHNKRVIAALSETERKILTDAGLSGNHNVLDAVGILLRHLRRI